LSIRSDPAFVVADRVFFLKQMRKARGFTKNDVTEPTSSSRETSKAFITLY
jgi:hypothetical protein